MKKIYIESLGCSKNLVDSENILGILLNKGYEIVEFADKADYILINTCSFIGDAIKESIDAVLCAIDLKKEFGCKIIVTGCLSQRFREVLEKEMPEVDLLIGTESLDVIENMVDEFEKTNEHAYYETINKPLVATTKRGRLTPSYYAYEKIAEGCNNHCAFCIIPSLRGKYRSKKIEEIVMESTALAKDGVKELILIAQDTSKYGLDLYGERKLHVLIQELSKIEGIEWIRIHYLYPEDFYDELIDEFANNSKLLNYFDIPLQHISDEVLKNMKRSTNSQQIKALIQKIREKVPNNAIRTSLITGFPGETEEDHKELMDFLKEFKLDRVGIFKYSKEENTAAYDMDNQIDEEVMDRRWNELMEIQKQVSWQIGANKIGQTLDVIIDEKMEETEYVGRTQLDAVDVDGVVYVKSTKELEIGNIYKADIVDALEYDLIGDYYEETKPTK